MFVGRVKELNKLNEFWKAEKFQCVVIYGRRRVGKTVLINEFIKNKPSIFFAGLETGSAENLKNLSRAIFEFNKGDNIGDTPIYPDYSSAFDAVFRMAEKEKLILVIDEYPYLEKSHKGVSSIIQNLIDKYRETSKLYLILCGSSMSFMENHVLGYKSPLYGRRTAQFKIMPFNFFETAEYFKKFNAFNLMAIYGITGGIPHYLEKMDENISVEENIINSFFDPSSFLFEEPLNLLKQEVRESGLYNSIISAIAAGSTKSVEISSKVRIDSSVFATYAANLISLGIIKKETPITEDTSRKTIYTVDDGMFRFWHRFIPDNLAAISRGMGEQAFRRIAPQIPAFLGKTFENVCSQYLWELNKKGETPFLFSKLGRWWGNNPVKKEEAEIDIIAFADNKHAIFAECKWTNEAIGENVLQTLIDRSHILDFEDRYYYVFAKNGFTSSIRNKSNVKLVTLIDMYKSF